jgi:hypothetical protein
LQHSALSKKFVKVMTVYNDIQAENKRKYKDTITRSCKVTFLLVLLALPVLLSSICEALHFTMLCQLTRSMSVAFPSFSPVSRVFFFFFFLFWRHKLVNPDIEEEQVEKIIEGGGTDGIFSGTDVN